MFNDTVNESYKGTGEIKQGVPQKQTVKAHELDATQPMPRPMSKEDAFELGRVMKQVLPHLNYNVCGSWVWISGTDRDDTATRKQLRKWGCKWSYNKQKWFLPGKPPRSQQKCSYEQVVAFHGEEQV